MADEKSTEDMKTQANISLNKKKKFIVIESILEPWKPFAKVIYGQQL